MIWWVSGTLWLPLIYLPQGAVRVTGLRSSSEAQNKPAASRQSISAGQHTFWLGWIKRNAHAMLLETIWMRKCVCAGWTKGWKGFQCRLKHLFTSQSPHTKSFHKSFFWEISGMSTVKQGRWVLCKGWLKITCPSLEMGNSKPRLLIRILHLRFSFLQDFMKDSKMHYHCHFSQATLNIFSYSWCDANVAHHDLTRYFTPHLNSVLDWIVCSIQSKGYFQTNIGRVKKALIYFTDRLKASVFIQLEKN